MLRAVADYEAGTISLTAMVGALQGGLDAGEFKDRELVAEFYTRWGPLEEHSAIYGAAADREVVMPHVMAMQKFLRDRGEQ